jgi:hypothetical protein
MVTVRQFTTAFPEFCGLDPEYIQIKLTEAARRVTTETYGDLADDVIKYHAAHRIWISPAGSSLRTDTDDASTSPYLKVMKELVQGSIVASRPSRGW